MTEFPNLNDKQTTGITIPKGFIMCYYNESFLIAYRIAYAYRISYHIRTQSQNYIS